MKLNYFKLLDKIGNDMGIVPVHLSRSSVVKDAISTGTLTCDLITGGGWPAGRWVALFGPEASCKSTLLYHTLKRAILQNVNAEFFDFEGSTDPTYLGKILEVNLNEVFGVRKEGGTWDITPKCRYHQPDLGELYFRYMHRILKTLPDKLEHHNRWYYVYDKKPKEEFSKKLYRVTKRYWVEAENGDVQVAWFIDSLPAMLPEKRDEKDDNKEIGLQARMFSQYIPLVKSRLARKRCTIVAVNQIRLRPMAFGNPEYETGGEAPKFYSDIRLQCRSCSSPFSKEQITEEPCWDDVGIDKYRYIKISTRKNKCFSPFRSSLMRVWVEEKGDTGRGLDPVFDTYQYLIETGQLEQAKKGNLIFHMENRLWSPRVWKWQEFKELILNPNKAEVYTKYNLNNPKIGEVEDINEEAQKVCAESLNLRQICQEQIRNGEAFSLYFKTICQEPGQSQSSKQSSKTCGTCTHFHKLEDCMEVDEDQTGCEDWLSEEVEEVEEFEKE